MYKRIILYSIGIPFLFILLPRLNISCANPVEPSGGPKDTIPPQITSTYPVQNSLDFKGKKIIFQFDKDIEAVDFINQVLISPRLIPKPDKKEWTYLIRGRKAIIKLIGELSPNTTYTVYLKNGIRDMTERNVAKNPTVVFSTGKQIDSLRVEGTVYDLMTNNPVKEGLVLLYNAEDTLDLFNSSPDYFTNTDEEGNYQLKNIKEGSYRIYATSKLKGNKITIDPEKTAYGFLAEAIQLKPDKSLQNIKLHISKLDVTDFILKSNRPQGRYFEIAFNKEIIEYQVDLLQKPKKFKEIPVLYANLLTDKKSIRVYNTLKLLEEDSIQASVFAKDIIGNTIQDTITLHFKEDVRAKENFTVQCLPKNNATIDPDNPVLEAEIVFNKPITAINPDNMYFQLDEENIINLTEKDFSFSTHKDTLSLTKSLDVKILNHLISMQMIKQETIKPFKLYLEKSSFISVDKDQSELLEQDYQLKNKKELGIIGGEVKTNAPGFIVQLLNKRYQVIKEIKNETPYKFVDIQPGKYMLRLLILDQKDTVWNPGNLKKNKMPAPVLFYPDEIVVRSNWESYHHHFTFNIES